MLNLPANLEAVEEEGSDGLARWRPSVSPYTHPCAAGAKPAPADRLRAPISWQSVLVWGRKG